MVARSAYSRGFFWGTSAVVKPIDRIHAGKKPDDMTPTTSVLIGKFVRSCPFRSGGMIDGQTGDCNRVDGCGASRVGGIGEPSSDRARLGAPRADCAGRGCGPGKSSDRPHGWG